MKYYHPIEDMVSDQPGHWSIALWEEPTQKPNSSFVPGTQLQWAWDSVSLGLFKQCAHKYYLTLIEGWHLHPQPVALQFGIYFHKCMETRLRLLARGMDPHEVQLRTVRLALLLGESLQPGRTERTKETLARAVSWYCEQFNDDAMRVTTRPNGEPTVEYSFIIPLADDKGPFQVDGHQMYMCGHLDAYVEFLGDYWVCDYKTSKGTLDDNFFADFSNSYQQKGYMAAAHTLASTPSSAIPAPPKGVIITGIELGVNYNRFARQQVTWTTMQLNDYLTDLKVLIESAALFADRGRWPHNETQCVGRYGKCPFFDVCAATPPARQRLLESSFRKSVWDPAASR
jgi:hypothetical protein